MTDVIISWNNSQGKRISSVFPEKHASGIIDFLIKLGVEPKVSLTGVD